MDRWETSDIILHLCGFFYKIRYGEKKSKKKDNIVLVQLPNNQDV